LKAEIKEECKYNGLNLKALKDFQSKTLNLF